MTYDQQLASDPKRSVWVSASAGTGKTKVLTDRVLRLLLSGVEAGGILCITFTKAAAAEMQARIERELGKWAVAAEEELEGVLSRLTGEPVTDKIRQRARQLFALVLDAPDRLRVQTIHSFCQSVIARFPIEAGVAPHVKLIDERDSEDMLAEARARIFDDALSGQNPRLARALRKLSQSIAESTLADLLQKIVSERHSFMPWLEVAGGVDRFLVKLHDVLNLPDGATPHTLRQAHFIYTPQQEQALRACCATLHDVGGATNLKLAASLALWLEKREDVQAYCRTYLTQKGEVRSRLFTKDAGAANPHLADILHAEVQRVQVFTRQWQTLKVAESSEVMLVLATALLNHYRQEKSRRAVMDYDDLISLTVQLLRRSNSAAWVLYKLDGRIEHLLVDEAQDTSPEQWQIVEALVGEFFAGESARRAHRTLFVVGDEKQSIFSFQGAEPAIFDTMRRTLAAAARAAGQEFSHVRLATSFRSTEAVLSAVDAVFATPAAREGLVFSEADISHQAHRVSQAGRVELWPLVEGKTQEQHPIWEEPKERVFSVPPEHAMAQSIADEIGRWLKEKRLLSAKGRPVQPGDVMILVQRRGSFAGAMLRALKRAGIPVAGADRLVITNHIAVQDCMAMADFLLLPKDDLTLAALLKSPLVGLSEEDLFTLAHGRGDASLWQRLRERAEFATAVEFLSDMLARADYLAPYELFSYALVTCGKRAEIARRLGPEADDPLNEFLSLALQYEGSHPPSLQGFMHWLRSSDTEIKRDMEKGRNEVRILTVHASKGLQAPIVFMPDTTRVPKHPDNLQWVVQEPPLPLWADSAENNDEHMARLKSGARAEGLCEYRRLLYVAMTRAEDELYVCGWKGAKAIPTDCWYALIQGAVSGNGPWQEVGDRLVLDMGQPVGETLHPREGALPAALPRWALQPAPVELVPSKPLAPSRMEGSGTTIKPQFSPSARARGVLVHRLLQYLPDAAPEQREALIEQFMERYGKELSIAERGEVRRQVLALIDHPQFAAVFAEGSLAEVPVVGVVNGTDGSPVTIAGQIDRLVVSEDSVLVVDYKTGHDVPKDASAISVAYRRQMEAYRTLLQGVYPDKTVACGIVWVSVPSLMIVE